MSMTKVIETALAELGQHEDPAGSNVVKYWSEWWPELQGKPWCVGFQGWVFNKAGERMAFYNGGKTASCRTLLRWYREQGLTVPVSEVQVGDIVLMNFNGKGTPDHCGLVDSVTRYTSGKIVCICTIEGNTSSGDGSQDNGGCVATKTRYPSQIVAVCRPQYKPDDPQPVDDVTGHWFTPSVEWAREKGLIKNYPDGSFKPNQPITRAEMCVMFERFYQLLWEDDMR